jgi:hypothetical protein
VIDALVGLIADALLWLIECVFGPIPWDHLA